MHNLSSPSHYPWVKMDIIEQDQHKPELLSEIFKLQYHGKAEKLSTNP